MVKLSAALEGVEPARSCASLPHCFFPLCPNTLSERRIRGAVRVRVGNMFVCVARGYYRLDTWTYGLRDGPVGAFARTVMLCATFAHVTCCSRCSIRTL